MCCYEKCRKASFGLKLMVRENKEDAAACKEPFDLVSTISIYFLYFSRSFFALNY